MAQRLAQLRRRFGFDQIGDGFGPGEIEPSMLDRAAGKFPRPCRPQAQRRQSLEQSLADRPAAMNVEFRDILAGKTVRRRKPQHQGTVDLPVQGPQGAQCRRARQGQIPRQRNQRRAGIRARDPHHGHPGPANRAGQGINRFNRRQGQGLSFALPPRATMPALSQRYF